MNPDLKIPALTTEQMREVDRLMVDEYGISLVQMMENAGLQLASLARDLFMKGDPLGKRVLVLAGSGGNGGGGLAAARRLKTWGADPVIVLPKPAADFHSVPRFQLKILQALELNIQTGATVKSFPEVDLILDALLGYGLEGDPRGEYARLIGLANQCSVPVLSLDNPSGLNTTTGAIGSPCMEAAATLTLALPKTGLLAPGAERVIGELYLADISVPPSLYRRLSIQLGPIFARQQIIKLS